MDSLFDALTNFYLNMIAQSDAVGQKFAEAASGEIVPWLTGLLLVWAIIFTLFEDDLVDGIRRVVYVISVAFLLVAALANWSYIANTVRSTSNALVKITGEAGFLKNAGDESLAVTAYRAMADAQDKLWAALIPDLFRSHLGPAPPPDPNK